MWLAIMLTMTLAACEERPLGLRDAQMATPTSGVTVAAPAIKVQVKFREGSKVRLRDASLVTLGGDDLSGVLEIISRYPGIRVERLFSRSEQELEEEQERVEAETGRDLPDLNLWYRLFLPPDSDAEMLVKDLNVLSIIEVAYVEPPAAPPPAP